MRDDRTEQDNLRKENQATFENLLADWEGWAAANSVKPYPEPKKRKQKKGPKVVPRG